MNAKKCLKWDTHHHIVPDFYAQEIQKLGLTQLGGFSFPKWSPEASLKMMAQSNIAKAFLSLSGPGVYFRDDQFSRGFARRVNDYVATITHTYPAQFGGFASVPLPDVDGALNELNYALDTLKLDGIVLMSNVDDQYFGSKAYRDFFAELNRRKAIVFVHPNISVRRQDYGLLEPLYWWQNDTTRTLMDFVRSGYHRDFPYIRFILSHGGGPLPVLYPLLIERLKQENSNIESELEVWKSQLFVDTASKGFDEQSPAILGFSGVNHVLYGSDYPWATHLAGRAIATQYANLDVKQGLSQATIQRIFSGNAQKLFESPNTIPYEAVSALSKPYEMMMPSQDRKVKWHYHCLPSEVMEMLQSQEDQLDTEAFEVWDQQKAMTWMSRNHFDKLILSLDEPSIWDRNSRDIAILLRTYNQAVAAICANNKDDFGAFGAIDLNHRAYALSEIDYCINELNLEGICLYTNISAMRIDQFIDPVILEKLSSLHVPILIHPKNTTGIPIVNENYLDSVYFMAKAFYLGIYEKYFTNTQLILTHTGGLVPYLSQPFNILFYLQQKKKKILPYLIDTYIKKQPKGYSILMNMIVD